MELKEWDEVKLLLLLEGTILVNTESEQGIEHYKFWSISKTNDGYKTSWGRIGSKIREKFYNSSNSDTEIRSKIKSKLAKGYRIIKD